ncbi:serine hydrolase [Flectobacillus roseus]|uniref:serine hydrolase n=1 Tax=Flectobacillus roseus TaxID=502259 RepID=UPI0024B81A18|nr:serine hydrolase [Flectobacillus roseus]MDI9870386.1 serine hydrolase [Flectobacillus roseus]
MKQVLRMLQLLRLYCSLFLFLCTFFNTTLFAQQQNASNKGIFTILDNNADYLLKKSKAYSVSIGIVKNGKVYTKHYGEIDKGKGNKADNNTSFDVASVTKVMTGYLMAKAVLEKKVNLDDDIRKYLDGSFPNLVYRGIPVRIKDLISFQSAFDREIPDFSYLKKNIDDSTCFRIKKIDESYSKKQFLEDLKTIKLDTIPGKKHKYSNTSLELSALILEKVYNKNFETLLSESFFSETKMKETKRNIKIDNSLASGYNNNYLLMPNSFTNLWAAGGYRNSTMNDLIKFLRFELDSKKKIVQESQRNISNSESSWNGYFWDEIGVSENGKYCFKHGGAFGTNTLFIVYPELQIGICVIVNISGENTFGNLYETVVKIVEDLVTTSTEKINYGYRLTEDKVIFSFEYNRKLDPKLIKSITVAGSFNDWNPERKDFKMHLKGNNIYELEVPKSQFEKGKTYAFKFVINQTSWINTPKYALNTDKTEENNLTFRID